MKTEYKSGKITISKLNLFERVKGWHLLSNYLLELQKDGKTERYFLKDYAFLTEALKGRDEANATKVSELFNEKSRLKNRLRQMEEISGSDKRKISDCNSKIYSLEGRLKTRKENYRHEIETKDKTIEVMKRQIKSLETGDKVSVGEEYIPKEYDPEIRKYVERCIGEIKNTPKKQTETIICSIGSDTKQHSHPKDFHNLVGRLSNDFVYRIDWRSVRPDCGTKVKRISTKQKGKDTMYYIDMVYSDGDSFGAEIMLWLTAKTYPQAEFVKLCIENDISKWLSK